MPEQGVWNLIQISHVVDRNHSIWAIIYCLKGYVLVEGWMSIESQDWLRAHCYEMETSKALTSLLLHQTPAPWMSFLFRDGLLCTINSHVCPCPFVTSWPEVGCKIWQKVVHLHVSQAQPLISENMPATSQKMYLTKEDILLCPEVTIISSSCFGRWI